MNYAKLDEELKNRGLNVNQLSMATRISASGLYAAMSGNSPLWPGWKNRIAIFLEMDEAELFPEEGLDED